MLLIEFAYNLQYGLNILKYRDALDHNWYYLYIDIETLHLLLINFGVLSTYRIPTQVFSLDTPLTSTKINVTFSGAPLQLYCDSNAHFYLPIMEQNY
jgi:hypothetical protein